MRRCEGSECVKVALGFMDVWVERRLSVRAVYTGLKDYLGVGMSGVCRRVGHMHGRCMGVTGSVGVSVVAVWGGLVAVVRS